jgi:hypothetical protein
MLRQVVPISISLQGDGTSTVFTFPVEYLFQSTTGSTLVMSPVGLIPTSAFITSIDPPAQAAVDSYGNLIITLFAPMAAGVISAFDVLLTFDSNTPAPDQSINRFAATTGVVLVPNATGNLLPLLSITPQIGGSSTIFTFRDLDILSGGQICHFQLLLNATLTGANFVNVDPASSMTYDISAASYTGGTLLDAGYFGVDSRHNSYDFKFEGGAAGSPAVISPIITLVFAPAARTQSQQGSACAFAGCSFAWEEQ